MKKTLIFMTSILMMSGCGQPTNHSEVKLIGGSDALGDSPYAKSTVKLSFESAAGTGSCSGTIIGPNQIVTAAHCATSGGALTSILSGTTPQKIAGISNFNIKAYPKYDGETISTTWRWSPLTELCLQI